MAEQILRMPDTKHTAAHDLESFFYVLLYMCTMLFGPNSSQKAENIPHFISNWMYSKDLREIGLSWLMLLTGHSYHYFSNVRASSCYISCLELTSCGLDSLFDVPPWVGLHLSRRRILCEWQPAVVGPRERVVAIIVVSLSRCSFTTMLYAYTGIQAICLAGEFGELGDSATW